MNKQTGMLFWLLFYVIVLFVKNYEKIKNTGYLASSVDQYAIALAQALSLTSEQQKTMQLAAREAVKQFSDEAFAKQFSNAINTTVFEQKP